MDKERIQAPDEHKVGYVPDELDIPEEIEAKEGVKATRTQFSTTIKADDGTPLVQSPKTKKVTITIPDDKETLEEKSKGEIEKSSTWLAVYWMRMLKKALYHGWNVISGKDAVSKTVKNDR